MLFLSNYKKEINFIIKYSRYNENVDNIDFNNFNWNFIIKACKIHRLFGLILKNIQNNKNISEEIRLLFNKEYEYIFKLNSLQFKYAYDICSEFEKRDIPYLVLKGLPISRLIYEDNGIRPCSDVDFYVSKKDIPRIKKMLGKKGFIQGYYDKNKGEIVKATRYSILNSELNTHELVAFVKIVEDNLPIYIDINFEFSWRGAKSFSPPKVKFENVFKNKQNIKVEDNMMLNLMNNEYFLLHLCFHGYNEAVFFTYNNADSTKDLLLFRFCDIRNFINITEVNWFAFLKLVNKTEAKEQVWYIFRILNMLWPSKAQEDVLSSLGDFDDSILHKYYKSNGESGLWTIGIIERLFYFDKKKKLLKKMNL